MKNHLALGAIALTGVFCITADAVPPCDGTDPINALCGANSWCANWNWTYSAISCTGNEIFKKNGQFGCSDPPANPSPSKKCGHANPIANAVWTTKSPCIKETETVEVDGVFKNRYRCSSDPDIRLDNSIHNKTDNILCGDQS